MIIKKSERKKHANNSVCIAYEYPLKDKDMSVALIELSGRYPSKGRVVNKFCKELIFVSLGKGKVEVDGKKFEIDESDALLILPGQKYFLEGSMELVISSEPAWHPDQHVGCD